MTIETKSWTMVDGLNFSSWLSDQGKSENTVQAYERSVRAFAQWFEQEAGMEFSPAYLSARAMNRWKRDTLEAGKITANTWNLRLAGLRAYADYIRDTEGLDISADLLDEVPVARLQRLAPRSLEKQDWWRVLEQSDANVRAAKTQSGKRQALRVRAEVYLAMECGLRVEEIHSLNAGDITISERKGEILIRDSKGQKERAVAMPKEARRAVSDWFVAVGFDSAQPALVSQKGQRVSMRQIQRDVAEVGRQVGVQVTPHMLRHTSVTRMLQSGATVAEAAAQHGHSNAQTTLRYALPRMEDLQAAVERM